MLLHAMKPVMFNRSKAGQSVKHFNWAVDGFPSASRSDVLRFAEVGGERSLVELSRSRSGLGDGISDTNQSEEYVAEMFSLWPGSMFKSPALTVEWGAVQGHKCRRRPRSWSKHSKSWRAESAGTLHVVSKGMTKASPSMTVECGTRQQCVCSRRIRLMTSPSTGKYKDGGGLSKTGNR